MKRRAHLATVPVPKAPKPAPKRPGRPRIGLPIKRIETLAAAGLGQREIGLCIGVSPDTLQRRGREATEAPEEYPESAAFAAAFARGRALGHEKTAKKILALADAGSERMLELRARCLFKWTDKQIVEHEGLPDAAPAVALSVTTTAQQGEADAEKYGAAVLRSLERQALINAAAGVTDEGNQ